MKRTGTMTPDGKGGYNIELNDPKRGFVDLLVTVGGAAATTVVSVTVGWFTTKVLKKLDKES